ncbi:hypothetical protein SVIRM249S_01834 [Streptomyces viridochromogenes]
MEQDGPILGCEPYPTRSVATDEAVSLFSVMTDLIIPGEVREFLGTVQGFHALRILV